MPAASRGRPGQNRASRSVTCRSGRSGPGAAAVSLAIWHLLYRAVLISCAHRNDIDFSRPDASPARRANTRSCIGLGEHIQQHGGLMRGKGINYDTGFLPGNHDSRPDFDPAAVAAEMRIIARELGCTAVRVSGSKPERISVAAEAAAAEGLEVWFAPFPPELTAAELLELFRDCADRAEHLRRAGASVVLVAGCELSLFNPGFLPGANSYDRIARLGKPSLRLYASFARLPKRLKAFLGEG